MGGVSDGGAGDPTAVHPVRWVPQGHPIHYCITTTKDFGHTNPGSEILRAMRIWSRYHQVRFAQDPSGERMDSSLEFVLDNECGTDTHIRFAMGEFPLRFPSHLFAAAEIQATGANDISRGTIWMKPNADLPKGLHWDKPNHLLAVLLHEIGHALGNGHIARTIMDNNLLTMVELADILGAPDMLEHIDYGHELVPSLNTRFGDSKNCSKRTYVAMPYSADAAPDEFAMETLVGREVVGPWKMNLSNYCTELEITDSRGTVKLGFQFKDIISRSNDDRYAFGSSRGSFSTVTAGMLTREDGSQLQVIVSQNLNFSPFAIDFITPDGRSLPFFRAANPFEVRHESLDTRFGIIYDME